MAIRLGKNTFEVVAPPGMESFALQQKILPVFGGLINVVASLFQAKDGQKLSDIFQSTDWLETDLKELAPLLTACTPALAKIFSEMPPGELRTITRTLLAEATCDKVSLFNSPGGDAFDAIMRGRTLDTWRLLFYALKVWYPDFFALAGQLSAPGPEGSSSEASRSTEQPGLVGA